MKKVPDAHAVFALASAIRERGNALILSSLARHGVTDILPAHGAALNALFRESPRQMSALAESIGRKKNTVTSLINTLEERGYCRRETDPRDARVQLVALTAKGEALRAVYEDVSAELLEKAWNGLDEEEKNACMRTLGKLLENLKDGETD